MSCMALVRCRWLAFAVALLLSAVVPSGAAEITGGTRQQWLQHRDACCHDPALVRYYTFANLHDAGDVVQNLAGEHADPLVFGMEAVPGAAKDEFGLTAGRWPGVAAVRLDQGYFSAKAPDVSGKAFTASMWFRGHGPGAHRGNAAASNGMLLAVGNGYWDGWRLSMDYPSGRIGLEIGRPQPSHSVGIYTGAVADGVWHDLAASWDGQQMRIYLDGELAASGAYRGDYTPPVPGGALRIGYADSGIGSAVLDVDEVAIWRRALSAEEILRDFYFYADLTAAQATQWCAAQAAAATDPAATEKALTALLKTEPLNGDVAVAVRLQLLDVRLQHGQINQAAASVELAGMLDNAAIPSRLASRAQFMLLALLRDGAVLPQELYARLAALPEIQPSDRLALQLGLGHSLAQSGDYAAAGAQYAKLADAADTPPAWRSVALMCLGRTCTLSGDYAAAKAAYEKVKTIAGEPRYLVVEMDERLNEVARLQAGKPARDPLDSRTKLAETPTPGATLYVAPDGQDANAGTQANPLATLARARDAIRTLRHNGGIPAGGVTVWIRGGRYAVRDTFKLAGDDSGTPAAPIIYRAMEGQSPCFDAGQSIGQFVIVRDPAILNRISPEARDKVYQTDLKAQGVASLGEFAPGGYASARGFKTHPLLELFCNGQAMPLARWPKQGFVHIRDVAKDAKNVFTYDEDRPARWQEEKDPWLYGYWFYDWADSYEKIAAIDVAHKQITLAPPFTKYGEGGRGMKAGQRYCAVNMLCEIAQPGEWYLDRGTGILYFYPPADLAQAEIHVSVLETPVMELDHVANVRFQGLTWENGRGDAIIIKNSDSCLLLGCTVRQFGGNGVAIYGGTRDGILGCDIHTLGRAGVVLDGGDRKTLTPGGHFVENCHIHHVSRIDHTYTPAVLVQGVGNRVAHNLLHDSTSSALRVEGNDHLLEFNEVHDVVLESDDQGGLDIWGNPTFRGNVFRYNYWHDIGNGMPVGQAGIRLDDFISGVVIYGNVFRRCAFSHFGEIQINGGKENTIDNNLFIDGQAALSGGAGNAERWQKLLDSPQGQAMVLAVNPAQPPYAARYPELLRLTDNLTNAAHCNVTVGCGRFLLHDQPLEQIDNWVTAENPGLEDMVAGNFAVKEGSALWRRPSFQPIPFGQIGLYTDQYRKTP